MDFVNDRLAKGRKLRIVTIVDTFSRFLPAVDPRYSFWLWNGYAARSVTRNRSGSIRGSEFISRDLDLWAYQKGVVLDFSRPGKPTDNAFIESINASTASSGPSA